MKRRKAAAMLVACATTIALAAPAGAIPDPQVRPAGGPHAALAAHALSATLGPCLATQPRARISVAISVARGLQIGLPLGRDAWGGMQIWHATLTAIVFMPDRIPQVVKASTAVASGWIHARAGTLEIEAAIGPKIAIRLATDAAPRVASALGCPALPGPATPDPPPTAPAREDES